MALLAGKGPDTHNTIIGTDGSYASCSADTRQRAPQCGGLLAAILRHQSVEAVADALMNGGGDVGVRPYLVGGC